jgi:hypothetical protein
MSLNREVNEIVISDSDEEQIDELNNDGYQYDNESNNSVDESEESLSFYDKLTEDEQNEVIETIQDLLEEYIKNEILNISKPNFHKDMNDDITHIVYQSLLDCGILQDDDDYHSLLDFVETYSNDFFENNNVYPMRSSVHSIEKIYNTKYGYIESNIKNKIEKIRNINIFIKKNYYGTIFFRYLHLCCY